MQHIILLGDSVFNNSAYAGEEADFSEQLRAHLPRPSMVTTCAEEGSLTLDVISQLEKIPTSATHLVVSVGGNDARRHLSFLGSTANSTAEVLTKLADYADQFRRDYCTMVAAARSKELPLA
ncbi:MAG TPA: hypothetical protein VF435_04600, partial [Pyrinomonadaceae bacterium]